MAKSTTHHVPLRLRIARLLAAGFALSLVFALPALADDDLPGRVGRIANFAGDIYLAPEDQAADWTAVGLNQPITTGDNLWVDVDGRAEVDYGGGQVRLGSDTNVHVSRLDDHELSLFIAQGHVIVRVRVLDAGDVAFVDTPNTQLQLTRAGLYRIDVVPDRETTTLVVREGEASIALSSGAQQALPGQTVTVAGTGAVNADIRNGLGMDGFDAWSADRDRFYQRGRSTAYVSRQMVGYADLDSSGIWESSPTYGSVWYPTTVVADWAPYRFGHWTWVAGFGYAWVDDAPWGYAPFHYGRWVHLGGRWGWCPGEYVARPIWAPALVGWYGGSGWSLSTSVGAPVYGWVPLAWGEPLHPWWGRCSGNCWTRYNRPYAVNLAERTRGGPPAGGYVNVRIPGAITAVTAATLAASRPVASNRVVAPVQSASSPPVLATAPPIRPQPTPVQSARGGSGRMPPPASTFYPSAGRGAASPSAAAPGATPVGTRTPLPPAASGAAPAWRQGSPRTDSPAGVPIAPSPRESRSSAAPIAPAVPVAPPPRGAVAAPAASLPASPRGTQAVVPQPRATVSPPAAPAVSPRVTSPAVAPAYRGGARQEGIVPPAAPPPPARAMTPVAPPVGAPAPLPQATPRGGHPTPVPPAQPQAAEKPNANPRGTQPEGQAR